MIVDKDAKSSLRAMFRQKTDGELLALSRNPVLTAEEEILVDEELRMRASRQPEDAPVDERGTMKGVERENARMVAEVPGDPTDEVEYSLYAPAPFPWGDLRRSACKLAFFGLVIGGIIFALNGGLDSIGWVSHEENSTITAQANWLVGESKPCKSKPMDANIGYAMGYLECDDGPAHSVKITFYGRKDQPEYKEVFWVCTRNSFLNDAAFTCKQTGGS